MGVIVGDGTDDTVGLMPCSHCAGRFSSGGNPPLYEGYGRFWWLGNSGGKILSLRGGTTDIREPFRRKSLQGEIRGKTFVSKITLSNPNGYEKLQRIFCKDRLTRRTDSSIMENHLPSHKLVFFPVRSWGEKSGKSHRILGN